MLKLEQSDDATLKDLITESKEEWIHVPEAMTPNSTETQWTVGFDPAGVEPRVAFELSQHRTATDTVTEVTTAIDQKGSLMPWRKNDGWVGEDYNPVNQDGWITSARN